MSQAIETIRSGDMAPSLQIIRDTYREAGAASGQPDPLQHRLLELTLPVLEALASRPLEVSLAWPSGVDIAARATIRAQLVDELTKAKQGALFAVATATPAMAAMLTRVAMAHALEAPRESTG